MSAVTGLAFAPTLPVWILVMLGAAGLLALVPAFRAATPGRFWRLLALALLVAWLAGPRLVRQQWRPRPDIALLMLDRSGSMSIRDRTAQVDAARDKILAEAAAVPGLELRVATVPEQGRTGHSADDGDRGSPRRYSAGPASWCDRAERRADRRPAVTRGEAAVHRTLPPAPPGAR